MFSSEAPTYLLRISGPFTTLGSRAFNIFPICRAINVLPVPGGPCSKIPIEYTLWNDPTYWKMGQTFYVLNAKLLDEGRGKHTRGECATEDIIKLFVETSDAHVLELEVGGNDRVRSGSGHGNKAKLFA